MFIELDTKHGHGLAVATYISLTSHLLPPESHLLASYTTHWSIVREEYYVATLTIILYSLVLRLFPARRGVDDHVTMFCIKFNEHCLFNNNNLSG